MSAILDSAPESIERPLSFVGGHAYAATWVHVEREVDGGTGKATRQQEMIVVRDDGTLYAYAETGGISQPISELGLSINLSDPPPVAKLWSGAGVNRYLSGNWPDPEITFLQVAKVINHFMDFDRSMGENPQRDVCDLVACYAIATWFLPAFSVMGYLWPNGESGAGKTHLLKVVCELSYLGQLILAGGSFASLRDMAHYGATLGFDDAEQVMDQKKGDPDKQALLLAGNQRGVTVPVKEPAGKNGWRTRHINAFCPRLFSAIRLPHETLANRSIFVPLVACTGEKANSDPLDYECWPVERRALIDDLWALALNHMHELRDCNRRVAELAALSGRQLQPWRAILAVALWLSEQRDSDLGDMFTRMDALSVKYQTERSSIEASTHNRVISAVLLKMMSRYKERPTEEHLIPTADIRKAINEHALDQGLYDEPGNDYVSSRSLGRRLGNYRLKRPEGRNAQRREWLISYSDAVRVAKSYGIVPPTYETSLTSATSQTSQDSDVNDVLDMSDVNPERGNGSNYVPGADT